MKQYWWQDAIIYQIYLRSFQDSNNDGIGDIQGVIQRLDYLEALGVNTLWISPHYDSPMDDNGYDVRNFFKVSEDYGTIDDFKKLIYEAHHRGIKIITQVDRGYNNLLRLKKFYNQAIITEMFFLNNPDDWIAREDAAKVINEFNKHLNVGA